MSGGRSYRNGTGIRADKSARCSGSRPNFTAVNGRLRRTLFGRGAVRNAPREGQLFLFDLPSFGSSTRNFVVIVGYGNGSGIACAELDRGKVNLNRGIGGSKGARSFCGTGSGAFGNINGSARRGEVQSYAVARLNVARR